MCKLKRKQTGNNNSKRSGSKGPRNYTYSELELPDESHNINLYAFFFYKANKNGAILQTAYFNFFA
jgi:hypothetical protein